MWTEEPEDPLSIKDYEASSEGNRQSVYQQPGKYRFQLSKALACKISKTEESEISGAIRKMKHPVILGMGLGFDRDHLLCGL